MEPFWGEFGAILKLERGEVGAIVEMVVEGGGGGEGERAGEGDGGRERAATIVIVVVIVRMRMRMRVPPSSQSA